MYEIPTYLTIRNCLWLEKDPIPHKEVYDEARKAFKLINPKMNPERESNWPEMYAIYCTILHTRNGTIK